MLRVSFFLRPFASLSAVIEDLYLIWLVADAKEFVDQTFYLPL